MINSKIKFADGLVSLISIQLRQLFRNGNALFFIFFFFAIVFFFDFIYSLLISKNEQIKGTPGQTSIDILYFKALVNAVKEHPNIAKYIVSLEPITVISFYLTYTFAPLLFIVIGYGSISGEIQTKSLKWFFMFSKPSQFYFSKFFSISIISLPIIYCGIIISFIINANKMVPVDITDQIPILIRIFFLSIPYLLCIISLIQLGSSMASSTFSALAINLIGWFVFFILAHSPLKILSPLSYRSYLFSKEIESLFAALFLSLLTIIFYLLGQFILSKREFK